MSDSRITAVEPSAPAPVDTALPWWARRVGFGWINVITGLGSLIAAAILVGERLTLYVDAGHRTSCDFGGAFSCSSVMKSQAAMAFGFPNPFIGLVGFTILVVVGVAILAGASFPRWFWLAYNVGVAAAFGFLVWLYTQAVYVISALCLYCMICWALMTVLVFIVTARNMLVGVIPAPAGMRAFARGWAWILALVVCLACAVSIVIHFMALIFEA